MKKVVKVNDLIGVYLFTPFPALGVAILVNRAEGFNYEYFFFYGKTHFKMRASQPEDIVCIGFKVFHAIVLSLNSPF